MRKCFLSILFLISGLYAQSHVVNGWTIPQQGYNSTPNWSKYYDSLLTAIAKRIDKNDSIIKTAHERGILFYGAQDSVPYSMHRACQDFNGTLDCPLYIGYNLQNGTTTTKMVEGRHLYTQAIENDYEDGFGQHYMEVNWDYTNPASTFHKRVLALGIDLNDSNWIYWGFKSTNFNMEDNSMTFGGPFVDGPSFTLWGQPAGTNFRLLSNTGRYRSELTPSATGMQFFCYDDTDSHYENLAFTGATVQHNGISYIDFNTGSGYANVARIKDTTMYFPSYSGTADTNEATYKSKIFLKESSNDGPNAKGGIEFLRYNALNGYATKFYSAQDNTHSFGIARRAGSRTWTKALTMSETTGSFYMWEGNLTMEQAAGGGGYYNATNHQWTNGSSRKIKKNIVDCKTDLRKLLDSIRVVNFQYRTGDTKTINIGFIAEETPSVLSGPQRDGMATANCIGFLIATVKKQQSEIDSLRILVIVNFLILIIFVVFNRRKK